MAFTHRSNNKILPSNSRAVDVAKQAIRDLVPIQQRKYHNAFEVQGFEAIVYNRLKHGVSCSCQAHSKVLATHLNEDGKMQVGKMNELLTGMEFGVETYGARTPNRQDIVEEKVKAGKKGARLPSRAEQFFGGLDDEQDLTQEFIIGGLTDPFTQVTGQETGSNGTNTGVDLDALSEEFESALLDSTSRCNVCYGIGFVGGFAPQLGWRAILSTRWADLGAVVGTIEVNSVPHSFFATSVSWELTIPKGFKTLDAFKVWNNFESVSNGQVTIDGIPYSQELLRAFADGRQHTITIEFEELTDFTHIEIQINLSDKTSLIEFPRLTNSSNQAFNDMTGEVTLNASPLVPVLNPGDVIAESTFGKKFVVGDTNYWNDRARNVLGWDVQARVLQPEEMLFELPRRRALKQRTTNLVRDNGSGIRRT